jgi:hypothetical protein
MRKFFRLQNLGSLSDPDLCRIEDPPRGIGLRKFCPALGDRASPYYPPDPRIQLREEQPGIQLSPLLGNNINYLIVSTAFKETIQAHCQGVEIEYLPFDLYDHRGRLYSRDYFIINPIGSYDCLDEATSGIEYGPEGSVVAINHPQLHPVKVTGAPALFRVRHKPTVYIVDETLAAAIREKGFTNVRMRELQMSAQPISTRS